MGAKAIGCKICGEKVRSLDLCVVHYHRFIRNGTYESLRPNDWGKRSTHPLWQRWKTLARTNNHNGRVPEWDDFWQFVKDVGEIPSDRAKIVRLREDEKIGPNNWAWQENWAHKLDIKSREGKNAYMREYNKRNPGKTKDYYLKRNFGIDLKQYYEMLEAQNHVCAICGEADTNISLAVDHDHKTNKVRDLLCNLCNKSLGGFKDNVEILESAIAYLKKHQST